MALETIRTRIAMLLSDAQHSPEDRFELHQQLVQQIGELRGLGLPVPADLLEFEQALSAGLAADRQ